MASAWTAGRSTADGDRYAVVGAGAAGLVTLKALLAHGIAAEILERRTDVGGMFAGRAGRGPDPSVHLVSSAAASAFSDLPFPAPGPGRPTFAQAQAYLSAYAAEFDLRPAIRLGAGVTRAEPDPGGGWWITTDDGTQRRYRGVVLAVGRSGAPRPVPDGGGATVLPASVLPASVLPAAGFRGPEQVAGRSVLVVGGGRAACEIAVEASWTARRTLLSVHGLHLPDALGSGSLGRAVLAAAAVRDLRDHGVPRPDPALFGERRGSSRRLRDALRHGRVTVRPPLAGTVDGEVVFGCGTRDRVDLIIDATASGVEVPFLDHWRLPWADGAPHLLLNLAHPARADLFAAGLFRTDAPAWPILERQAELIARLAAAGPEQTAGFRRRTGGARGATLDIAAGRYVRALRRAARDLDAAAAPSRVQPAATQAT